MKGDRPVAAISFVRFCAEVVRRPLTRGQTVFARVLFDRVDPCDLDPDERAIAQEIFGPVDLVPSTARRIGVGVCGRDSGKTTIGATLGLHRMLTAPLDGIGHGEIPIVAAVAPDLKAARLSVRMGLGIAKATPSLARLIESEGADGFTLRRPDGTLVGFDALAASRGGSAVRGRPILLGLLDEASLFYAGDGYVRTDDEILRALTPRVMPGGMVLLLSTPWGEESVLTKLFHANFGNPTTALVARATTLVMRDNDPHVAANVEAELQADPENAQREFFCVLGAGGTKKFFDPILIDAAVDREIVLPATAPKGSTLGAGMDLGLSRDSAALAIAASTNALVRIISLREILPKKGAPLKLSETIGTFAEDVRRYGIREIMADAWCREPAREYTDKEHLGIADAPSGQPGKQATHVLVRKLVREGRLLLPNEPRLITQLKNIISKEMPGGGLKIESPRRAGQGHGDLASAAILAIAQVSDPPARIRDPDAGGSSFEPREGDYRMSDPAFWGSERGF